LTGEFQSGLFENKICQLPKFAMNWQNKSPDLRENAVHVLEKFFRQND